MCTHCALRLVVKTCARGIISFIQRRKTRLLQFRISPSPAPLLLSPTSHGLRIYMTYKYINTNIYIQRDHWPGAYIILYCVRALDITCDNVQLYTAARCGRTCPWRRSEENRATDLRFIFIIILCMYRFYVSRTRKIGSGVLLLFFVLPPRERMKIVCRRIDLLPMGRTNTIRI